MPLKKWNGNAMLLDANNGLDDVADAIAAEFKATIGKLLSRGGGPSRAGSPPALGSGGLRRSWLAGRVKVTFVAGGGVSIAVTSSHPAARIQEFGGVIKGSPWLVFQPKGADHLVQVREVRLPPRPYIRPALRIVERKLPEIAARVMRKRLNRWLD